MCVDIRGMLRRPDRELRGCTDDDGRKLTPRQVREALMDELAKGRKVLPFGPICEGFSFETGCPGHENETLIPPAVPGIPLEQAICDGDPEPVS